MNNQRRSLRQQAQIEAPHETIDQRQARYDRTRSEMDRQADRVRTSIKEMILYASLAGLTILLLIIVLTAVFGNLKTFLDTSSFFMQLLVHWFIPIAIAAVAYWLLQRCY